MRQTWASAFHFKFEMACKGPRIFVCVVRACIFAAALTTAARGDPIPRSVLVLDQTLPGAQFFTELSSAFRSTLNANSRTPTTVYLENLDLLRFGDDQHTAILRNFLQKKYAGVEIGIVMAVGPQAYKFALQARSELWPDSPLVFLSVDGSIQNEQSPPPNVTGVTYRLTPDSSIAVAKALVTNLKQIVMISGRFERQTFRNTFKEALRLDAPGVELVDLTGLSLDSVAARVSNLPSDAVIFYLGLTVDGEGVNHDPRVALASLAQVANRPIIIDRDFYFGFGGIGGYIVSIGAVGAEAARLTAKLMDGEKASALPVIQGDFAHPVFDWRLLEKWAIRDTDLPPGSEIRFRQPGLWEQYELYVLSAVAVVLLQFFFIALLILNRRRLKHEHNERRQAEKMAISLSGHLISAQEEERSRLARELHDDVTQRLALLAIEAGRSEKEAKTDKVAMRSMREDLVRLSEDVHALSYRLHPSILDDLGLTAALNAECERFLRLEAVALVVDVQETSDQLPAEAALCIFRIAQEALRNVSRHAKANNAALHLRRVGDGFEFCVEDDGIGFDVNRNREQPSLGLASMQQRIYLLGGTLKVVSAPGRGTKIVAWIPWKEETLEAAHIAG